MRAYLLRTLSLSTAGFALAFNASSAFAAFSADDLLAATKLAYSDFTVAHPDHLEHFTGFKTWKSGEDARVKVYVTHDGMNMEFNYLCHKHDDATECHHQ